MKESKQKVRRSGDGLKFYLACAASTLKDNEIYNKMEVANGTFYNYQNANVLSEEQWATIEKAFPGLRKKSLDEFLGLENYPEAKTPPTEAEGVEKSEARVDSNSYAANLKSILAEQKLTSLRLHDIEGLLTLLSQSVGKIQAQLDADNTGNNPDATQEQHRTPRKKRQST